MTNYNTIAENPNSTVVAEYIPTPNTATNYQTESDLEKEFIAILKKNGYKYLPIKNDKDLLDNLRVQISRLNNYEFSNGEWSQVLNNYIANKNESIVEKTTKIQDDYIYNLKKDNGETKNIRIIDKDNIHNNHLQVINQYEVEGAYKNRYDVTILINGLPLVHIELKRRGVAIREAFNQINRYKRDSFWADSGLFEFVHLFIISNGTHTKYYSNTTRHSHIRELNGKYKAKKTSNSFEFTSWWTDAKNNRIADLVDFAETFFSKHTLLSIITKYCVFTEDKLLLVLRPYQIAASEKILNKITIATNSKQVGGVEAGGYIWHTTGSGKTLTSFKTAQLASGLANIDKVLFVVDRKDLDYQTMKEYDKFEKGAANSTKSTKELEKQLSKANSKIIITTIQKLSRFIDSNRTAEIFNKHIVIIFDECHRSQFGDMHTKIIKAFKNYHIFGFTGTPIFVANANQQLKTTEQAFGIKLHSYNIVDAIGDGNVLPFRLDYVNTIKMKDDIKDKKVIEINTEKALIAPERITEIVKYILEHFTQKTKRNENYKIGERRLSGFNSIFAVSSIDMAKKYYMEFREQQKEGTEKLKVALIYSFSANEELEDGLLPDEDFETDSLDKSSRDFLENAIADYNKTFSTNYDTSSEKFQNYYKDLSQRVKNREVDLLIVVNMFLTGFDATTLNTLWVDKNLRHHGLLQAFSRTNRILNSVKTFGNIVCFRDLEQATNDALAIFGNRKASGIVLLKTYNDYYNGYEKDGEHQDGYKELIGTLNPLPIQLESEQAEKDFIKLYGAILRVKNILMSFDEFVGNEILSEREFQDCQSAYLDLYDKFRKTKNGDKENINDDVVFEMELVKQITINIDYILFLVAKYQKTKMKDKEILITIDKAIKSSVELRSKEELIKGFINTLNAESNIDEEWKNWTTQSKAEELGRIIKEENLKPEQTYKFIENAFRDGEIRSNGTEFAGILPAVSMFSKDNKYVERKLAILERLKKFFEKYN